MRILTNRKEIKYESYRPIKFPFSRLFNETEEETIAEFTLDRGEGIEK